MLIFEYREVRFDAAALRAALQVRLLEVNARQPQGQGPPPTGTVVAASVAQADPLQLTVEIAAPEGTQRGHVVMEAVEVAAALIRACMQRGIRLPRNGTKSVRAAQGGVALVVTVTHAEGASTAAGPRSRAA
jgi:glycine/D-amino acid oxidase-like deaminating enzyme